MPIYNYSAKSLTEDKDKSGTMEAKDLRELAYSLKEEGFILIKAESQNKDKESGHKLRASIPFLNNVSLTEKMMFTRNLQVMTISGLSLPRSLDILSSQSKNKRFKKILLEIKERIVKGENFSVALKSYPNIFSDLYQNMIKVGEESGTLEEVLGILARQLERDHDLKSKIKSALMYPAVILFAMSTIGVLMMVMVVPKLAGTFQDLGVELPITTKFIIALANFITTKWYLFIIFIIIFIFGIWISFKNKKVRKITDALLLRTPIFSPLIIKTNSARFSRTLSSLMGGGVSIVRSLEITSGVLGNFYFKEALIKASEQVGKGKKISDSLEEYKHIYPIMVLQMIKVGEETGETSSILAKLADFYEEEVTNSTKSLASIIEPVLMLVIGAAIGFFAVSMIQPMYSILDTI